MQAQGPDPGCALQQLLCAQDGCAEMVAVQKESATVWLGAAGGNRMLRKIGEREE